MSRSFVPIGEGFALTNNGHLLRTPNGHVLQHRSLELIQHILDDADTWEDVRLEQDVVTVPASASALAFLVVTLEGATPDSDPLVQDLAGFLMSDPVLYTIPGPEQIGREATYEPVRLWLSEELPALRRHVTELQSWAFEPQYGASSEPTAPDVVKAIDSVQWLYSSFSAEQRAVVRVLYTVHERVLLLAMSLIVNPECDERQYADGVIGALMLDPDSFTDASHAETQRIYDQLVHDATRAMQFLAMVEALGSGA